MRCGTGSHTTINLRQEGWAAEAGVGLHTHKVAPARLFHPSIHNQATPGQTGTGTDTQTTERRQPDTSTPSKQRDPHLHTDGRALPTARGEEDTPAAKP